MQTDTIIATMKKSTPPDIIIIVIIIIIIIIIVIIIQGAFNCGPSSHPDFIKNYFLLKRMFRFFRHSRQMPYFNVSRQKSDTF